MGTQIPKSMTVCVQAPTPPSPALLPRELEISTISLMEPGEISFMLPNGIAVDLKGAMWADHYAVVMPEANEKFDVQVRRTEHGIEVCVPHQYLYARCPVLPFNSVVPVLKCSVAEDAE